ncbi:hypothetical protein N865_03105 [Intrasporangium oryzae NRRL B-24470]|uniref:Uncharacterized protein n=2 Tax=Intrasporangium TaxID=53357 RepID=W9G9N9_9MICO|nr:hypothetical protein N865_03105 [Intrasporangium oryzae NRRL B-24470]
MRQGAEIPLAIGATILLAAYVWVLMRATTPVVTVLAFLADGHPKVYAGFLAVLVGLPGLFLAVPRALTPPPPRVTPSTAVGRPLPTRPRSFVRTDVLAAVAVLFAQVPLPPPWQPVGKAATIANITRSAELVELSARFGTYSLVVLVVGVFAAVMAKVYNHAAGYRVIAIILAVGAPVVAWFLAIRVLG